MKEALVQLRVPLSRLVPSRRNPRQVKPGREADRRLAALIRSQGLLQPLLVRPIDGDSKRFEVVAGHRRLRALREIHRGDGDPKVPCVRRDVDASAADAMSLGENFGREPMHPLDEAEAFAGLARREGKDAKAIAAEFGVSEHYVKQRIKLATLAGAVKAAYREGKIDTATAEAFAAVPQERQLEVWEEVGGPPATTSTSATSSPTRGSTRGWPSLTRTRCRPRRSAATCSATAPWSTARRSWRRRPKPSTCSAKR